MEKSVKVRIEGRVQGVGYRYFAQEKAVALGLSGWVRNLPNGDVEALGQGSKEALTHWLKELEHGPSFANVVKLHTDWDDSTAPLQAFTIR